MPPKPPPTTNPKTNPKPAEPFDTRSLVQVTEVLAKAKQLRNYFQLERDKIQKFWDITMKELENAKYELVNADHDIEAMEDRHLVEMRVYKQKVRHLLYEHKETVRMIRSGADESQSESVSEHKGRVTSLKQNKTVLHSELQSLMTEHEAQMKELREGHRLMLERRKKDHDRMLRDVQKKFEQKLVVLRDELDLRRRAEIHDLEERKNEHINELLRRHQAAFLEMKKYYNEITANNLDLIKCLKDEISSMKKNEEHNENLMYEIAQENKGLNVPLTDARKVVEELRAQLHNYDKDKLSLRNTMARLSLLDRQFKQLTEDHATLQKKYMEVETDRDDLASRFERVLYDAKERAAQRTYSLEEQLNGLINASEQRDAQLVSVLSAANLDPHVLDTLTRKLEDLLESKNRAIKDLHFELHKVEQTHQEVVAAYERKCTKSQLPVLDLKEILQ
eukprot:PhM_4_TR16636/c0_g1_i1/m.60072/K19942/GAS8; growth arrest-specific protein 8